MPRRPRLSQRSTPGSGQQKAGRHSAKAPSARAARSNARAARSKPAAAKKPAESAAKATRSGLRRPSMTGAPWSSELKPDRKAVNQRKAKRSCRSVARHRFSGTATSVAGRISRRLSTGRSWAYWRSVCERVSVILVSCVVLACSSWQDASIEPLFVVWLCV